MALTLMEAEKYTTDTLRRGVIEVFARNSVIFELLPFMEIAGNAYAYNTEEALPGIAFRGVNEGCVESAGVINQESEKLTIMGGDVDVDKFLAQTRGNINDIRGIQTEMKSKALALSWTRTFFKGDSTERANEFDGLEKRVTGKQVLDAGGAPISLELIDELIDMVEGEPDVLLMSKAMRRKIKGLLQGSTHYIESGEDSFGRPVNTYGGIPIRIVETDEEGKEILGFDEEGGTASIYAIKFGADQYVSGLRNGTVNVRDLGEIDAKPVFRTRIEFYSGMAIFHPRAVARLKGIGKGTPAGA